MTPGGESPLRKVWTVGPVAVWADSRARFTCVWCDACGRLAFLVDARVPMDIIREAARAHAEKHEA